MRLALLLLAGCGRLGFDAGADGAQLVDSDGDGIADPLDNCPGVANPDQANEDGDRFGDACDPCPPFADADPVADADGDGVPDACDPFPAVAGETIVLFEGFTAPTTGLVVGSWSFANGQAIATSSVDRLDDLVWPSPGGSAETVMTHMTIDAQLGAGHARGTGIIHELGTPATDGSVGTDGVVCMMGLDTRRVERADLDPHRHRLCVHRRAHAADGEGRRELPEARSQAGDSHAELVGPLRLGDDRPRAVDGFGT